MSQKDVEIVRQFAERWERSDWEGMAELADPDVEMHATVGGVEEGRVRHGVDAIRQDYEAAEETWDEHRIETERVVDAGDRIVLLHREYMRGKNSGMELDLEAAVLIDLREGRIVRVQGYMDRTAALDAAGLTDQAEG
ncbi:MAG TPA: nuclear transport factor 2 family protein [Solirubrobacterales bacterium]|nr:nuclear transport factor 2 family protein [Solirubrobacterales bacterium]